MKLVKHVNQVKYTSITFSLNMQPLKLRQVSRDFRSFYYWLERKQYHWTAINVYDRTTHQFIVQLTPQNYWIKIKEL